ncbi:hypothetical protein PENANT_c359G11244, partial [Penicillium antarcticum]
NAGLAQGSPLSPILFAFFNADLVDQPVDSHGGASAFIDDYFRWRVGRSAEENLVKIQSEDITRIEEGESGSQAPKALTYGKLTAPYRRGHNWLSNYRKEIGYSEHDRCECGAQETVAHIVSSLLGGSNEGDKGKPDTVSRAKTVQAVLDFAEASQRFRSRAL